jgi:hypothetical protein
MRRCSRSGPTGGLSIQHRRVPVVPREDLAERHVLKVVCRVERLAARQLSVP